MEPLGTLAARGRSDTTDAGLLVVLATVAEGLMTLEQAEVVTGLSESDLLSTIADPIVQKHVSVEGLRLRQSGKLADMKSEHLMDRMLSQILSMDAASVSPVLAAKFIELGLKFRERAPAGGVASKPEATIVLLYDNDPEPEVAEAGAYRLVIRLPGARP